jgi:biotin carboxyl carrier protein
MRFVVRIESRERFVNIEEKDGHFVIEVDGRSRIVDHRKAGHADYHSLIIDNRSYLVESAPVKVDEGRYYVNFAGHHYDVEVLDERLVATRQASAMVEERGPYVIKSPMPGLIVDVRVKVGDTVSAGGTIVIMEAMKMRNELVADIDGTVTAIHIKAKDTVDSQAPLIEIQQKE